MKKILVLGALVSVLPTLAFAHHPLGGMPMETFAQGILSGIGHPILGFDHLFFVALVGVAALYTGRALLAPFAYISAMIVGCLMMSYNVDLPIKELVIGLSLLTLGYMVLSGRALSLGLAVAIFAGFGLFHGSAFGDSIASQESAVGSQVLIGYLIGLGVVQYGISLGAGWVVHRALKATEAAAIQARLSGAVVAGIGLFLSMENLEGVVFQLAGWTS